VVGPRRADYQDMVLPSVGGARELEMRRMILRFFVRGLVFGVPVALTGYVGWRIFVAVDNLIDTEKWFGVNIPGLGVAATLVGITALGLLTSLFLTRWMVDATDRFFKRLPLAKTLYSSVKDLLEAFVGEKKKFDTPVLVAIGDPAGAEILGFITRRDCEWLGRSGRVAVYCPQSYNFAGQVLVFPSDRVTKLEVDAGEAMQFIVSGGVSTSND